MLISASSKLMSIKDYQTAMATENKTKNIAAKNKRPYKQGKILEIPGKFQTRFSRNLGL